MIALLLLLTFQQREIEITKTLAPKYKAEMQVTLEDGTFCDLLTATHAIEVDYARKWYEAVGQALHYSELTEKKPGIILLVTDPSKEWIYLVRCATICGKYDIKLWVEVVK